MKVAAYVEWILLYKRCKFGEKICNNSRDIEFFLGDYFLAHPLYIWVASAGGWLYGSQVPEFQCMTASTVLPSTFISVLGLHERISAWSSCTVYIKAMSAFMLHMHIALTFTWISLPNLASFGKEDSKSASAQFSENAKFRPWIAPKCVWRPGSARTRWES